MGLPSDTRAKVLPGQSKTFPSTAPDIEVSIASRLEISSLGQKAERPVLGREVKGQVLLMYYV